MLKTINNFLVFFIFFQVFLVKLNSILQILLKTTPLSPLNLLQGSSRTLIMEGGSIIFLCFLLRILLFILLSRL